MSNEHIAATGVNTYGTTLDLIIRPNTASDPRCDEIIKRVVESVMVAFPAAAQQSIEDAVVTAIAAADGRFSSLNLNKISSDTGNRAEAGSDGGIYVGRRLVSASTNTTAGVAGLATLAVPFGNTDYSVTVQPAADPGAFRWWVVSKTTGAVVVGFFSANAVVLNIAANG